MKIRIIRVNIRTREGLKILKPNNMVIDRLELEDYRKSLKESEDDTVLFTFEEIDN